MKRIIYNFLDSSVGPGVRLAKSGNYYNIYSNNWSLILSFRMRDDWEFIKLYRYEPLCRTVSGLFSVTEDEAANYISNWFGDRHNLKKVSDLRKFVPQLSEL
jgi:hypothetical protein